MSKERAVRTKARLHWQRRGGWFAAALCALGQAGCGEEPGPDGGSGGLTAGGAGTVNGGTSGARGHGGAGHRGGRSNGGAATDETGGATTEPTSGGTTPSAGGASSEMGGARSHGGDANPEGGSDEPSAGGSAGTTSGGSTALGGATVSLGGNAQGGEAPGSAGIAGDNENLGEAGEPGWSFHEDPRVTWLGACTPLDLSDDGNTALALEGLWNRDSGWTALPQLPGTMSSAPNALSGDGSVVFGIGQSDQGPQIFRWTTEGGMVALGGAPFGPGRQSTTTDGSTLVTCGETTGTIARWDIAQGFSEFTFPDPPFPIWQDTCDCSGAAISNNGETLIQSEDCVDTETGGLGPWIQSSVTVHSIELTSTCGSRAIAALSGDGSAIAFEPRWCRGNDDDASFRCLYSDVAPIEIDCRGSAANWVTDLNYDGTSGVGYQQLSLDRRAFYWSVERKQQFLSDAFAEHGVHVDAEAAAPSISADGKTIFGVATRHHSDGSHTSECYIGRFGDRVTPPSHAPPQPPPNCGNGVLDPDEECDDGNPTNGDGCTTYCRRPQLAASHDSTCAIRAGRVACWGQGAVVPTGSQARSWSPAFVPELDHVVQVANGSDHACALLADSTVRCWGDNRFGQLGDGTTDSSAVPATVADLSGVVQVSVGHSSSCVLLQDGTVSCWGMHGEQQQPGLVPTLITGVEHATQLSSSSSDDVTCAVLTDHSVTCWGSPPWLDSSAPKVFVGAEQERQGFMQVDGVQFLKLDGTVQYGSDFNVGGTLPVTFPATPIQIVASNWFLADQSFTCALLANGHVECFSPFPYDPPPVFGELGTRWGSANIVPGIDDAVEITAGDRHVCALRATGEVYCWGRDSEGQLGIGYVYTNAPYGLAEPAAVSEFQ